jgi:hypothetical protein
MFRLSRYLPIGRSTPEAHEDPPAPAEVPAHEVIPVGPQGIQMITLRRGGDGNIEVSYASPRVVGGASPRDTEEIFFETEDEDSPPASAVAAVRLCVWFIFLFGFLFLFQRQQAKFEHDRSQQSGARLRNPQVFHMRVPWVDFSGFAEEGSNFVSHFIDSNASTLSVYRMQTGGKTVMARRLGISGPLKFDASPLVESGDLVGIHSEGPDSLVSLRKLTDTYELSLPDGRKGEFKLTGSLSFFRHIAPSNQMILITQNDASINSNCLSVFTLESTTPVCRYAEPILASSAYFFDQLTTKLVSVGLDDITRDHGGFSLHGVYIQARKIGTNSTISDFSISVPFLHRLDDGLWVMQNNPVTQGFVVLMPTMGFPQTPVQHIVAIREGTGDFPKGTVFRMESPEMELFRKIDSIPFHPAVDPDPQCHC